MERKKLLQILYDALPDKTKVRTGITVSKIDQSGQGKGQVRACTVSGEVFEADLVVGADGVHSSVRSQIWKAARPGASRMLENEDTSELKNDTSIKFHLVRTNSRTSYDCGLFMYFWHIYRAPTSTRRRAVHAHQRWVDSCGNTEQG